MEKESLSVRFLYRTLPGRVVLKALVHPQVSKIGGAFLSTRPSSFIVPFFIKKNGIDMSGYEKKRYSSFNDFFIRKRATETSIVDENGFYSPCDGYLKVLPINEDSIFTIKNTSYNVSRLLKNHLLGERYAGGYCFIFRLMPKHYHRYSFPCTGKPFLKKKIPGVLHCVRPIAYEKKPVFVENAREYTMIKSEAFGNVLQMEVGALMVGKISNHVLSGRVYPGLEKGYFEFGGSTIIVLVEQGKINPRQDLLEASAQDLEVDVTKGESLLN